MRDRGRYLVVGLCLLGMGWAVRDVIRTEDRIHGIERSFALAALDSCLEEKFDPGSGGSLIDMPPGTITTTDKQGVARRLPGSTPVAYAYWGNKPHLLTCGIALYGHVPTGFRGRIVATIEKEHAGWQSRSSYADHLSGVVPAHRRYWGQPDAPDRNGILLLTRDPGDTAPTLEVEAHLVAET